MTDSGVTLESYSYLGLGTVVVRSHPQNGVDLSYVKLTGEAVGDAGDQYTGLDRFGRIVDQRWRAGGVDRDRNQSTYDRDGNRLTKVNSVNSTFNEVYTYDGLSQVASFNRGSGARTQSFDYDALGNRDGVTTNGSTQAYTANKQNEITSISGATTPAYDANGNMTGDETGKLFVYDAWNRLVAVKSSGGTVLKTYGYDALNHRVSETVSGTTTDLYDSAGWQVLEERVGGVTRVSNVWSPVYVDAMVARDRDADGNGSLEERLYVTHDANFNVTGLINTGGAVVERYVYDTYGAVTVLNASWTVLGNSAYAWVYLHQGGRVDGVSGRVHFRNRDYSVTLGRFTSVDSSGFGAGDTNLYRAEGNGQTGRLDPSGLSWEDTWDELVSVGEYVLTNPVGTVVNWNLGIAEGAVNLGIGARNTAVEMYYLGRDVGNAGFASYTIVANGFGYWDIGYVHTFDFRSNTMRGYDQSVHEHNRMATPFLLRAMLDGASLGTRPMALGVADYAETGDATRSSQTCGGVAFSNLTGAATGVAFGRISGVGSRAPSAAPKPLVKVAPNDTFPANSEAFTKQLGVQPTKITTTKDGTGRMVWEPNSRTRIRYESHPEGLKPGDPGFNPRHHGEHYHVETKPDGLSWGQAQRQGMISKVKPEGYTPGSGTGFVPNERFPR